MSGIRQFLNNDPEVSLNNVLEFDCCDLVNLRTEIDGWLNDHTILNESSLDLHEHIDIAVDTRRRLKVKATPANINQSLH